MRRFLKVAIHPVPEKEQSDTGLRYTDILFGFVIRELFSRFQNLAQVDRRVLWHLVVGTTLVLGSWIGYRRSLHRSRYQVKFFNLPLFQFIVDQMMLILYFRIAVQTDLRGNLAPGVTDLARSTTKLVIDVFVLYLAWDLLGMWIARAKIRGDDGIQKLRYPEAAAPNWIGLSITLGGLLVLGVLWLVAGYFDSTLLFPETTAVLLMYRWAKEIRTSWRQTAPS
jgi:hypothetical protein